MPKRLGPLAWLLFVALIACRRDGGPPKDENAAAASPCPPFPAWASKELPAGVLVDVLHVPSREDRSVGYRLHEDGRLETHAKVELVVGADGQLTARPIAEAWKEVGRVPDERLETTRRLIREASADELRAWAGHRGGEEGTTFLRMRRDGQILESCYFGDRAPPPLGLIERHVLDLRLGIVPPPIP